MHAFSRTFVCVELTLETSVFSFRCGAEEWLRRLRVRPGPSEPHTLVGSSLGDMDALDGIAENQEVRRGSRSQILPAPEETEANGEADGEDARHALAWCTCLARKLSLRRIASQWPLVFSHPISKALRP